MADAVEQLLERQIPALRDFVARRIMTSAEAKALVEQRRLHEYRLQRRAARKVDFVRYVEYELKVDALRRIRKARLQLTKQTTSDFAQVTHVFFIFERAVRKFQGDPDLWLQYIDFSIGQRAEKRLGTLFPRALQLHPRNVSLWIRAASWQYFDLSDATAARVLLHRALRINPRAPALWLQYFKMEFHYVSKLGARRDALGLEAQSSSSFHRGAVPRAVFDNAVMSIPHSLDLRVGFLRLASQFDNSDDVTDHILASIASDFREDPQAWIVRATHCLSDQKALSRKRLRSEDLCAGEVASVCVLEQGVAALPNSTAMWSACTDFLIQIATAEPTPLSSRGKILWSMVDNLFERAAATLGKSLHPCRYIEWAGVPVDGAGPSRGEAILRRGLGFHGSSVELWESLLRARCWATPVGGTMAMLREALAAVSTAGPLRGSSVDRLYLPVVEKSFQAGDDAATDALFRCALACGPDPPAAMCCQWIRWAHVSGGVAGVENALSGILEAFPGGGAALVPCLIEAATALGSHAGAENMVRRAFTVAARCASNVGTERAVLEAHAEFEHGNSRLDEAEALRWRAQHLSTSV